MPSKDKPPPVNADAAKRARILLDIIAETKNVATALSEFRDKRANDLPSCDVNNLDVMINALLYINEAGRQQTARVSVVSSLLPGYDMLIKSNKENEAPRKKSSVSESMSKLKAFNKNCKNQLPGCETAIPKKVAKPLVERKQVRRSERTVEVTPEKANKRMMEEFNGNPPNRLEKWSKEDLIDALNKVEATEGISKSAFVKNVIAKGKSDYASSNGIYKMHRTWKETGEIRKGSGRPMALNLNQAKEAVTKKFKDGSGDSSAFRLKDMKNEIEKKKKDKAEKDGLDSDTIKVTVCDKTAKAAMVAVAMDGTDVSFTKKKLMDKTERRFQAENSLMGAYAYATTVLSTHFVEGPRPRNLKKFRPQQLSKAAKDTMEEMKIALNAEELWPVDPNLVLSTDDTTLFVFEGANDKSGDWEWKLIDKVNGNSSVSSDFEVGEDAENSGGLRVRLTFTFTASGLAAPPYVAISGLTESELSPELCPDGILATKVKGLCKGGDDIFNTNEGWLVFLRADRKDREKDGGNLSIANKKFIHYNDDVLLPFIQKIRETLGWKRGQAVPDCLKAISWFDGDIGQLQTMIYEAREALDRAENIIRNKHSAASTARQQPCDLSPVFKLMKQIQKLITAKEDTACGLRETIDELFSITLRAKGLNLDANPRKKKSLIDFLLCLPELLEMAMKKKHIKRSFVEAGMIDEETGMVPVYENLMSTCRRWGSSSKDLGVPKHTKQAMKSQFQHLMELQLKEGQITYADMKEVDIPLDIDSSQTEIQEERPSGADREHLQLAKTINAAPQQMKRMERRRKKLSDKYKKDITERNIVRDILAKNKLIEDELKAKVVSGLVADATLADFLGLTASKLQDFIHCRKFNSKTFSSSKLCGANGKLNKVRYSGQKPEDMLLECDDEHPCLVWLAWKARSDAIILQERAEPVLDLTVVVPTFMVEYAGIENEKLASEYLSDQSWVNVLGSVVKGVEFVQIDEELKKKADHLALALEPRLHLHVADRVAEHKQGHWSLRFTRDNLAPMAAAMCLVGHIVEDIETYGIEECLLGMHLSEDQFKIISGNLGSLEGCYLFFDKMKRKWIRSGKTGGEGVDACFNGRINTHKANATKTSEMREHRLYAEYPARGVEPIGKREGYFDNLDIYCGMAYDARSDVSKMCPSETDDSLFVWSKETISQLKKRDGKLQTLQLEAIAYLWELCYDLLLAKSQNVSSSPGFEKFGLRENNKKRSNDDDEPNRKRLKM